jgi:hypothetical protein
MLWSGLLTRYAFFGTEEELKFFLIRETVRCVHSVVSTKELWSGEQRVLRFVEAYAGIS